jgi:predicted Zn-dependent peptidase
LEILNSITPADIRQAARTYLSDDRVVEIRIVPESGK